MKRLASLATFLAACSGQDVMVTGETTGASTGDTDGPPLLPDWPAEVGPCALPPDDGDRLVLTTTDFSTGAITVVDANAMTLTPDVALSSTDAIPVPHAGRVHVLHRFQHDYIDILAPDWGSLAEVPVTYDGVQSANPQSLVFGRDGLGYAPLFAAPAVAVFDLSADAPAQLDSISLEAFADADGTPEAGHAVVCGDILFVTIERLDADAGFMPIDGDHIVAIDLVARLPHAERLPLKGEFVKQLRRDPNDPGGTTVLALTTGIERINLAAGTVNWAVPESVFAQVELDHRWGPQSFDVNADGTVAYVSGYDPDFAQVRLFKVGLDGGAPTTPVPFAEGLDSVERTVELLGDRLWHGSTRSGKPGLWVYDVSVDPPAVIAGPLSTGLPPYSMAVLP